MFKAIAVLLAVLVCTSSDAQYGGEAGQPDWERLMQEAAFRGVGYKTRTDVEGSPFFNDNYIEGTVMLGKNVYRGIKLKINLEDNSVWFQDAKGSEMICTSSNLHRVVLPGITGGIFQNGFPATGRNTAATFYRVLDTGRNMLLMFYEVSYTESIPYGSATPVRKYSREERYFIYTSTGEIKMIKSKDDVLELFAAKKDAVASYLNSNKMKCKSKKDLLHLVMWLNSQP